MYNTRKIGRSFVSIIIIFILIFTNCIIIGTPKVQASGGSGDTYSFEAEVICHKTEQIPVNEPTVIKPYPNHEKDPTITGKNFYSHSFSINMGYYKYYFRARSEIDSTITIGVDGIINPLQEDFLLTKEYRWYKSDDFIVGTQQSITIWAHSNRFAEFIDKIIIIQWKIGQTTQISGSLGQIVGVDIDSNLIDSDYDGIIDKSQDPNIMQEYNENVWWLEAEHFRHDLNVNIGFHPKASNGKVITINGDILHQLYWNPGLESQIYGNNRYPSNLGLIPMLKFDYNDFPMFEKGDEFQLFVRAKGPKDSFFCIETGYGSTRFLDLMQGGTPERNFYVDKEFRWFSSPRFSPTCWGPEVDPEMWIQILSTPPTPVDSAEFVGLGCVSIDKLMLLRTKDDSNPPEETDYLYGQITDPLDPDTDIDGRDDGIERNEERFWFEAEGWIHKNNWDSNHPSLEFEESKASNSKSLNRVGGDPLMQNVDYIWGSNNLNPDYLASPETDNRIYFRSRTKSTTTNDIIKFIVDDGTSLKTTQFVQTPQYRWFITPPFNPSQIIGFYFESTTEDVLLDKIMIANELSIVGGQISDPLDPDMDWDKILDFDEISDDVYWIEGESILGTYTSGTGTDSNGGADSGNSFGFYVEDIVSYSLNVPPGEYQLLFRIKDGNYPFGDPHVDVFVEDGTTPIYFERYLMELNHKWYHSQEFIFTGTQITVKFVVDPLLNSVAILDKFSLVKRADLALEPSDRPSGVDITDPMDPDTDWDLRIDGNEYSLDLRWFEAEHYSEIIPDEDTTMKTGNNYFIKSNSNENLFHIEKEFSPGEYHVFVKAKKNDDSSTGVKLVTNVQFTGDIYSGCQYLVSDYNWYDCISFKILITRTIIIEGFSEVPVGQIMVDRILIARTKNVGNYPTDILLGKLSGPRTDFIFKAQPGLVSDSLDKDTDGDTIYDSAELNGIVVGTKKYKIDPLLSDTDHDGLLDNIEISIETDPTIADSDGDKIPDGWIDGWGYDKTLNIYEIRDINDDIDIDSDFDFYYLEGEDLDRDGIIDKDGNGYFTETSPYSDDTDDDDLNDNYEYIYEIDPLDRDTDDDAVKDGEESSPPFGVCMANAGDFDGDGLTDGLELGKNGPVNEKDIDEVSESQIYDVKGTDTSSPNYNTDSDSGSTMTNPRESDTDHDGLPDGWIDFNNDNLRDLGEFEDFDLDGAIKVDPINGWDISGLSNSPQTFGSETDPDNENSDEAGSDVFSDGMELMATSPTDPLDETDYPNDGDSDGLEDNYEDTFEYDYSEVDWDSENPGFEYYTDPTKSDTDGDGLLDGVEVEAGTNPLNPDSDFDGIADNREGNNNDWDGSVSWDMVNIPDNKLTSWEEDSDGDSSTGGYMKSINALDWDSDDDGLRDWEEARVSFRTNVFDATKHVLGLPDYWIAVNNIEDDWNLLEGYGAYQSSRKHYIQGGETFITKMPEPGYEVWRIDDDEVFIKVPGISGYPIYTRTFMGPAAALAETNIYPHPDCREYIGHQYWDWYTNPTHDDTDGDGLTDYEEVGIYDVNHEGIPGYIHNTNPLIKDTDNDGLPDLFEVQNDMSPNDENGDFDNDGITDKDELSYDFDKILDGNQQTDFFIDDTDNDGLLDGSEFNPYRDYYHLAQFYLDLEQHIHPLKQNSDEDPANIIDGKESIDYHIFGTSIPPAFTDDYLTNFQEQKLGTQLDNWDSDGDGYYDGYEIVEIDIENGVVRKLSDPLDGTSKPYDTDGDLIPNFVDDDDDNDGIDDEDESDYSTLNNGADVFNSPVGVDHNSLYLSTDEFISTYRYNKDDIIFSQIYRESSSDWKLEKYCIEDLLNVGDDKSSTWLFHFGDINGDGIDELINTYFDDNDDWICSRFFQLKGTRWEFFKGVSGYTNPETTYAESSTRLYHFGDLNGDGIDELIKTHIEPSANPPKLTTRFYGIQNGKWKFISEKTETNRNWPAAANNQLYHYADYNNDGKDELIYTTLTSGTNFINTYFYKFNGPNWAIDTSVIGVDTPTIWNSKSNSQLYHFGDIDGDGRDEFISTDIDSTYIEANSYYPYGGEWCHQKYILNNNEWPSESATQLYHFGNVLDIKLDTLPNIETYNHVPTVYSKTKIDFDNTNHNPLRYTWTWDFDTKTDADDHSSDGIDNDKDGFIDEDSITDPLGIEEGSEYDWDGDFVPDNDGDAGGRYPVHTFSATGEYDVKVTVSDGYDGCSEEIKVIVKELKTDQLIEDSDGDGLRDGDEFYGDDISGDPDYPGNPDGYITNPCNSFYDTDGDFVSDFDELLKPTDLIRRSNSLDPIDNILDEDLDGLNNFVELNVFGTYIRMRDSDRDGLIDGFFDTGSDGLEPGNRAEADFHIGNGDDNDLDGVIDDEGYQEPDPDGSEGNCKWDPGEIMGEIGDIYNQNILDHNEGSILSLIEDTPAYWIERPDPCHKDIYVEVDYMVGHEPSYAALQRVLFKFGGRGITLHIDHSGRLGESEQVLHSTVNKLIWQWDEAGDWNDYQDYLNYADYFLPERHHIFHYCLFAHDIQDFEEGENTEGISGDRHPGHFAIAEIDMINNLKTSQTFMHELGHTLGLNPGDHPGGIDDDIYSIEEYPSVMNYKDNGVDIVDYSDGPTWGGDYDDWSDVKSSLAHELRIFINIVEVNN